MTNTVDVYKRTQQGNLLGPHGGGGVVGYSQESLLWHPPRKARILPGHICKRAAYSETEKRFDVNFSFEEEHMNLINTHNFLFTLIIVTVI